jgi:hypothetical protein
MIYDEESDRHVHITFEDALHATAYGSKGGPTGDLFDFKNKLTASVIEKMDAHAGVLKSKAGVPIAGEVKIKPAADDTPVAPGEALPTYVTGITKDDEDGKALRAKLVKQLIILVKAGVYVPVEIVVARPFIEHLMLSAIVAVSGRDTGATLFGPADMRECYGTEHCVALTGHVPQTDKLTNYPLLAEISANTSVKTIEGALINQHALLNAHVLHVMLQLSHSLFFYCVVRRSLHVQDRHRFEP